MREITLCRGCHRPVKVRLDRQHRVVSKSHLNSEFAICGHSGEAPQVYSKAQLIAMPILRSAQVDDLKLEFPAAIRVWVSRLTKADGEDEDRAIFVEAWNVTTGNWSEVPLA